MSTEQEKTPQNPHRHGVLHIGDNAAAWLKPIFSFFLGALSAAFLVGSKSRDVSDLLTWKGEAVGQFKTIAERFERLDRDGTNRSRWTDDTQAKQIADNVAKIADLEKRLESRGEAISVMEGKIQRLENEIRGTRP